MDSAGHVFRGDQSIELEGGECAVLRMLLAHAGQVVTPIQFKRALWGESAAPLEGVTRCVAALSNKLGPEPCIEAVYKRGFRISLPVRACACLSLKLPRLAILPPPARSGVPEYLGLAIAEETGAQLHDPRNRAAEVLAQESVTTLARRKLEPQQIAEAMHADLVLRTSLSASPSQYRLRAEMSQSADGSQLWIEDVAVARSRVSALPRELADRVRLRLGDELSLAASAEPGQDAWLEDASSYEMFQRAHHDWLSLQRHAMQDAMQRLLHIAELNPRAIPPRVDIANLCVAQAIYGYLSPEATAETMRRMVESCLSGKAVSWQGENQGEPDSRYDALLPAQGWFWFHVARDLPSALWAFERSAHLPHDPWTTRARSMFALSRQRYGEAIELMRSAMRIDPYSGWLNARLTWALHLAGEAEESHEQAEHSLKEFPENEAACAYGALILAWHGEASRAVEIARALARRAPQFDMAAETLACALACAGRKEEANGVLEELEWLSRERFVLNTLIPAAHVAIRQYDTAIEELRIAERARSPWFFQMIADPQLRPLHDRPEFKKMAAILPGMEEAARGS